MGPQVSPDEIKSWEVVVGPQVSPDEIKSWEVVVGPQVSPDEIKRREVVVGLRVGLLLLVVSQRRSYGHCDSVPHSSWDSNCVVH